MTAAERLVARLRARGLSIEPDPPDLVVSPAEAVTAQDVAEIKRHKPELLALLTAAPPGRPWVDLDPRAVRQALGPDPDAHALAMIRFDVLAAVRQLEAEIATDAIDLRPLVVRGRPLGEWLDLGDVARLLRLWHESPRA